jgi:hypothetical protein
MINTTGHELILIAALGFAGFVFWRLYQRNAAAAAFVVPAPGAPPGSPYLPLGQYSVAPDRQWLLIRPGT